MQMVMVALKMITRPIIFFAYIIEKGADLGSEDESYVSDALVKLAGFIKKGILQSSVKPNLSYATLLYIQAR